MYHAFCCCAACLCRLLVLLACAACLCCLLVLLACAAAAADAAAAGATAYWLSLTVVLLLCWLLVVVGCCLLLLVVAGCCWFWLVVVGCWLFLAVACCGWLSLVVVLVVVLLFCCLVSLLSWCPVVVLLLVFVGFCWLLVADGLLAVVCCLSCLALVVSCLSLVVWRLASGFCCYRRLAVGSFPAQGRGLRGQHQLWIQAASDACSLQALQSHGQVLRPMWGCPPLHGVPFLPGSYKQVSWCMSNPSLGNPYVCQALQTAHCEIPPPAKTMTAAAWKTA